ncbi:MAG: hypothetical protein WC099_03035 [Candidatus Paceibacterota bacterium]
MQKLIYLKESVRIYILTAVSFMILVGGLGLIAFIIWLSTEQNRFLATYGSIYGSIALFIAIVILSKGAILRPLLKWSEYLKKGIETKTIEKIVRNILLGTASILSLIAGWYVYLYQLDKQEKHVFITLGFCFLAFVIFIIAVNHARDIAPWIIKKIQDKDILTNP